MPQYDYAAYAKTTAGIAARAKARAKWLQKRKDGKASKGRAIAQPSFDAKPLVAAINNWTKFTG